MTRIFQGVAAAVLIAAFATGAFAASNIVKCHNAKGKAAAKAFSACMKCRIKHFTADDAMKTFDVARCQTDATNACMTAFSAADTKYGVECVQNGNGSAQCGEISNACTDIYVSN
jgi:hypothetical protein